MYWVHVGCVHAYTAMYCLFWKVLINYISGCSCEFNIQTLTIVHGFVFITRKLFRVPVQEYTVDHAVDTHEAEENASL